MQTNDSDKRPRAILFMGIQASGKSTFYKQFFSSGFVHINLDTLHTRYQERLRLESCLQQNLSFVVDNTNPTCDDRKKYIEAAKEHGYEIHGYFFQSVIKDCIGRNSQRTGKANVPDRAIVYTSNRLELPRYEEGFDQLYFVGIRDGGFHVEPWKE